MADPVHTKPWLQESPGELDQCTNPVIVCRESDDQQMILEVKSLLYSLNSIVDVILAPLRRKQVGEERAFIFFFDHQGQRNYRDKNLWQGNDVYGHASFKC